MPYTKWTLTTDFIAVCVVSALFPHPPIPLDQRRLRDCQQKAWPGPTVLQRQSLEEMPIGALPGYRATMTPPHTPAFYTLWGLSVAEIFRSICKTGIVTETSQMVPKMIFLSTHLQHSAEACNCEPQWPRSPCIATVTRSTKPTLEVLPWPRGENVGWIPDMPILWLFVQPRGRTLRGVKQRFSCSAPPPTRECTEREVGADGPWHKAHVIKQDQKLAAHPLPSHGDRCGGTRVFVPAAKDLLGEGRQQGDCLVLLI